MAISVIVTTSPGREQNLDYCLRQLTQQTHPYFEVLVCDDGSVEGAAVVKAFDKQLNVRYFTRPNDMRVSRSRNLGAEAARHTHLVFIDGDILLNPTALVAYQDLLAEQPHILWAGYVGSVKNFAAPSLWQPSRAVNYLDKRYSLFSRKSLQPRNELRSEPGNWLWSGNIAMHTALYHSIQGFDESFVGWGAEDVEFGFRALAAGHEIHFCLDPWAEHQQHSYEEDYHTAYRTQETAKQRFLQTRQHPAINYTVEVVGTPAVMGNLCQQLLAHYAPQDPTVPAHYKQDFHHPQARLLLRDGAYGHGEMGVALPRQ